jgi:tetrapyrrole methylase family protein/MazG family protein
VAELKKAGIGFRSYDSFYEQAGSFEELYAAIAEDVVRRGTEKDIVYAVPGSPLVAERTVVLIRELAAKRGVKLTILPGMSFLEVLYTQLGIDPIAGIAILDAEDLDQLPCDWPTGLAITQLYRQEIASEAKLALMAVLPDDFEVVFVHDLGLPDEVLRRIPLFALDRQPEIDHLTSLYVPPQPRTKRFDLKPVVDIMHTLRSPGGCPWDILQTHKSLRRNIIEEVYEVLEAIELEDEKLLCEELGDLLLQIVFHARMAEEAGEFSMQDVVDGITQKLIRRHPHIFGDVQVSDAAAVLQNWEAIKKQEKPERTSALDGVPLGLPALMSAEKLQKKAGKVGFDWKDILPVWDKVHEELNELQEAVQENSPEHRMEELGDVLFAIVNLARFLKVDPELALMATNRKFQRRFSHVEKRVKASGKTWEDFQLKELDAFWNEAKKGFLE